jgi:peptidoglycan hydrolase-like protein with peptidoglycan-binding domain
MTMPSITNRPANTPGINPGAVAATTLPKTGDAFLDRIAADAIKSQRNTGVPASVTMAQALLESDRGRSGLTTRANNFFGIKGEGPAGHITMPTRENFNGRWVTVDANFRKYNSPSESFDDHGKFLRKNPRYAPAFKHTDDARQFAREIHKAGYATDPQYSNKLISIMKEYGLERFDQIGRSGQQVGGTQRPPSQLPAFDGKYTQAPSLDQVKQGENLKVGHEGSAVEHVQEQLHKLGYLSDDDMKSGNGKFGPKTQAAVDQFQRDRGLTPPKGKEGEVGPTTLAWLENGGKKPATGSVPSRAGGADGMDSPNPSQQQGTGSTSTQLPAFDGKYTQAPGLDQVKQGAHLKIGHEGSAVEHVQEQLHKLGYLSDDDMTSGNGKFGPKTQAAVHQFQKDRGLTPPKGQEGEVGPKTLEFLEKGVKASDNTQNRPPATPGRGQPISLAPQSMSMKEKYDYYAGIVRANGGKVNPNGQATVLGLRGLDGNGNRHATNFNKKYDDTFIVLKPNGTVQEFRGSTHSNPRYQPRAPDANRDGRGDLGMIRPGNYSVVPNGPHVGNASYHVRTEGGSGSLPAYRDTDQSNSISQAERETSKARGYKQTEILFHQAGSNDNGSMGCQTIAASDFNRFISAVGGRNASYNYSLVDANGN